MSKTLNEVEGTKTLSVVRGFTLLEVLIAMFFVTVGITGAFTLIQRTVVLSSGSLQKLQASYLAQEGLEIVRNIRDSNIVQRSKDQNVAWTSGLENCEAGCQADYNDQTLSPFAGNFLLQNGSVYSYDDGIPSPFQRKIMISSSGADALFVRSEVLWSDRGVERTVEAESELTNWFSPTL